MYKLAEVCCTQGVVMHRFYHIVHHPSPSNAAMEKVACSSACQPTKASAWFASLERC